MITVDRLGKLYDRTEALCDLSFEVKPGEILGLVGPNGAGKTTTLRIISGILPATSGRVTIGGFDLDAQSVEAKRLLAYVPDMAKPFETLTVMEHLRFTAALYDVSDLEARSKRLLEEFELTEKRDTPGGELSHGMKQKLAVCCAYLHDPKAIFLDEPLTGLDPRAIRAMIDSIRARAAAGAAVILSSHLLEMVERVCSRVLIVHKGRRVALGTVDELKKDATLEQAFLQATQG